jgi:RHS repeat-associated protein
LGNVRAEFAAHDSGQPELVQQADYYPFGYTLRRNDFGSQHPNRRLFGGKELQDETIAGNTLDWYDFEARMYDPVIGRFLTTDPMAEKYYSITPYGYCTNNPINIVDNSGKEWTYAISDNGNVVINLELNFSVNGDFSSEQINSFKQAIAAQFQNTLYESSNGTITGNITFYDNNPNIVQSLVLDYLADNGIGGTTSYFHSSVNLSNSSGKLKNTSDLGIDAIHEVLHTLRLDHPFEITQSADTKLIRTGIDSYASTPSTDPKIVDNIMNYPMISIDGKYGTNQTYLTKGQLAFMIREIDLQNQGYGFKPKYDSKLSQKENAQQLQKYYEEYWYNIPGTPVGY